MTRTRSKVESTQDAGTGSPDALHTAPECPLRRLGLTGDRLTLLGAFAVGVFLGFLLRD